MLHYIQYYKNISHHRGINATPYSVHFGRTPLDISVDMSLPREAVLLLETEEYARLLIVCKVVDNYETTQCSYCREELSIWHLSCIQGNR